MKSVLPFATFLIINLAILIVAGVFLSFYTTKQTNAKERDDLPIINLASNTTAVTGSLDLPKSLSGEIISADARILILENFFKNYRSPMVGTGADIVAAADKYKIPFNLISAIGQCEGALGKVIPKGSYNTWGYGIYGGKIKYFDNWQEGIEAVSHDLRVSYFNRGLDTPEKIMTRYTPGSNGSWAICVNRYMQEISEN
jgi:hypothetical protein